MGLETIALISVITAAAAGTASAGFKASQDIPAGRRAKNKQENLERERREQLTREGKARDTAKARAATAGSRVGTRSAFVTGLGFGSGTTSNQIGRGNLFGN